MIVRMSRYNRIHRAFDAPLRLQRREVGRFCFKAPKEGMLDTRKRFELRITDEDRQRLRALAEQHATTESDAIRALIREANIRLRGEGMAAKEEAVAA
jgi:hypothetical protein